jgi:hypothetical protein
VGSRGRGIKRTISLGRRIGGVWGITWGRYLRRRGEDTSAFEETRIIYYLRAVRTEIGMVPDAWGARSEFE